MVHLKRLSTIWAGKKKLNKYITVPKGAHPQDKSIPLVVILRDLINVADNSSEVKSILNAGKVLVDGKVCRDFRRGIGLFDTIQLADLGTNYRMVVKNKLKLIPISKEEANVKLCRVTDKTVLRGGKIQLNLHDGRNIISDQECGANDSVLISLPDQGIKEVVKFGPGSLIMTKHGDVVKVKNIERGLNKRILIDDDKEVPFKDFIVIGTDKPLIKVSE